MWGVSAGWGGEDSKAELAIAWGAGCLRKNGTGTSPRLALFTKLPDDRWRKIGRQLHGKIEKTKSFCGGSVTLSEAGGSKVPKVSRALPEQVLAYECRHRAVFQLFADFPKKNPCHQSLHPIHYSASQS